MAVNFSRVTQGSAQRGWTAGSIAPRVSNMRGPFASIGTSGNIPSNIMQAIGNLSAEQAFRQFLGSQVVPQTMMQAPVLSGVNPAAALQAGTAQQAAARRAADQTAQQLSLVNQNLLNFPSLMGGIAPMGMTGRANLQQQQFDLQNQLAAANAAAFANQATSPRALSGWVGGF